MWKSENEYQLIGLKYIFFGCLLFILFLLNPVAVMFLIMPLFGFFFVVSLILFIGSLVLVSLGLVLVNQDSKKIARVSGRLGIILVLCYLVLGIVSIIISNIA